MSAPETLATSNSPTVSTLPPPTGAASDLFFRQLLDALTDLRAGNFDTRLPNNLLGLEGRIADVVNDIALMNSQRSQEIARVCRMVGKEGKVKERIRLTPGLGARSAEITAMNTLIDDLVWPTIEVTRAVGAVAKGDLSQSIDLEVDGRPLEGEFLRSAKLVNKMIDQLSVFASEVTRVAREVGT